MIIAMVIVCALLPSPACAQCCAREAAQLTSTPPTNTPIFCISCRLFLVRAPPPPSSSPSLPPFHHNCPLPPPPPHRNSIRIGFFEWTEKKHADIFGGEEKKEAGEAPSGGITVRTADAGARVGVEGGAPVAGKKRLGARLYSCCCVKCGEDSLHWAVDTSAGVFLVSVFVVASAVLLATKPPGCGDAC